MHGTTVFAIVYWATPDEAIDVVFAPDDDYGDMSVVANRQAFLDDVADLITWGFWQNSTWVANFHLFNFWYTTVPGNVSDPQDPTECPSISWPAWTDAQFAEVKILVHTNPARDCSTASGAIVMTGGYNTAVHEASHQAFNLPDEYCCDGGYHQLSPILYTSSTNCNNDSLNAGWRDCQSFTTFNFATWWRSEDDIPDLMSADAYDRLLAQEFVTEYGPADWEVVRGVLESLPGARVNTPSVFAPDRWEWR
jgi:hypothetical protein